jgi:hypothetical protein
MAATPLARHDPGQQIGQTATDDFIAFHVQMHLDP